MTKPREELMELDAGEKLDKRYSNRFEAVLVVAKHARRLNLERLREKPEEGETVEPEEKQPKVIAEAMSNVLEGKVELERPERT
jgi:DNA-directed RNA polymerase omega subunit